MTEIYIDIDVPGIKEEVEKLAAYEGAKNQTEENETYERLFISKEEWEVLEKTMEDATTRVARVLEQYVTSVERGDTVRFTLSVPDNFRHDLTESMTESVKSFYIQYLAARWMSIANKEAATIFTDRAADYLEEARVLAHKRKRPDRRVFTTKYDLPYEPVSIG